MCYINLARWNRLQKEIVNRKLVPFIEIDAPKSGTDAELIHCIETFYLKWLSPISRKEQITSNLKLGFGLLFAIPITALILAGAAGWDDRIVKGVLSFVIGGSLIELIDFYRSPLFDTPIARKRRGSRGHSFPGGTGSVKHVFAWILNLFASTLVVYWSELQRIIESGMLNSGLL